MSIKATYFWFAGATYTRHDVSPIVHRLEASPELVGTYQERCMSLVNGLMAWGDYKGARELFDVMLVVLAAIRKGAGEQVLE